MRTSHTEIEMQLSVNREFVFLSELRRGEQGILEEVDLPETEARRLMELGFTPGVRVTAALSAPGGDPRVFQVDGAEIAVRRETAARMKLRPLYQSE